MATATKLRTKRVNRKKSKNTASYNNIHIGDEPNRITVIGHHNTVTVKHYTLFGFLTTRFRHFNRLLQFLPGAFTLIVLCVFLLACTKGGMEDEALTSETSEPSTITVTSTDEKPYFYAYGELTIELNASKYDTIELKNYVTKEQINILPIGIFITESLTEEWYYITSRNGYAWDASITGQATAPLSSTEPDPSTGDCNCQGCCSSHGGVICFDGRTMCEDGTGLSDTCSNKGCIANGCPGCE